MVHGPVLKTLARGRLEAVPFFVLGSDMADSTQIEWTDSTWNPVTGCTKLTAGCDHCYAERFSERFRNVKDHPFENGFDLTVRPERVQQPLAWKRPRRIFVNSMSDLFHKEVPVGFIDLVFDTMEKANWHTFQVLTKRSSLMTRYLAETLCWRRSTASCLAWRFDRKPAKRDPSKAPKARASGYEVRLIRATPVVSRRDRLERDQLGYRRRGKRPRCSTNGRGLGDRDS